MNAIFKTQEEVATRLEQLGASGAAIREAVNQGYLQRERLTANHPIIYHGLNMWGETVAALREQLLPQGWRRQDIGSYALTVHEERNLAIIVASGDENTGNPDEFPSNNSKKGRNTVEAVEANRQLELFENLPVVSGGGDLSSTDDRPTWVLLHYTDVALREIRLELSRPLNMDMSGKFTEWAERIILNSISLDDDQIEINPPNGPDIDIDIRRKA